MQRMFFYSEFNIENESFPEMDYYNEGITLKDETHKIVALCGVEQASLWTNDPQECNRIYRKLETTRQAKFEKNISYSSQLKHILALTI